MERDFEEILHGVVHEGVFRFCGNFDIVMRENGSFRIPEEWREMVSSLPMVMVFDEIEGAIYVYYEDDEPSLEVLEEQYKVIVGNAAAANFPLRRSDINHYQFTRYLDGLTKNGSTKINPMLLRGNSISDVEKKIDEKPFAVQLEGCGHYFKILRPDRKWAINQTQAEWEMDVVWPRVFAVRPIINQLKEYDGFSALERGVLTTDHPSDPERNPKDLEFGGVSDAPLPGLAEPS